MQSEDFDDKIKGAAERHHPPYDEQAWNKMEKLLDKHMPQEKEKRRGFLFFLLLFLLLGTGAFLIATKPWEGSKKQLATGTEQQTIDNKQLTTGNGEQTIDNRQQTIDNKQPATAPGNFPGKENTEPENKLEGNAGEFANKNNKNKPTVFTSQDKNTNPISNIVAGNTKRKKGNQETVTNTVPQKESKPESNSNVTTGNNIQSETTTAIIVPEKTPQQIVPVKTNKITAADSTSLVKVEDKKTGLESDKDKSTVAKSKKQQNKKMGSFFFSLSTGPDISYAGSDKAGKAKLLAGLGLGYTFNDKLTLRTGFYSSRKIYSASPEAYHPPANFNTYYPNLQKVDADCKVYEIPVSISYHFGKSSKQNWFVSTGLSTYLMKKESYDYYYKYNATSPTIKANWTTKNENNHFFSVATLSAGYQRQLNKTISISAEPYLKLPLSGVGYGKVKLNSAGVLFSINIKPFGTSKKIK